MLGQLPLYYLGRLAGEERLKRWADRYGKWLTVSHEEIERAKGWFERHGGDPADGRHRQRSDRGQLALGDAQLRAYATRSCSSPRPARGRTIRKAVPSPGALSTQTRPSCSSSTFLTIARPSPLPLPEESLRWNGSKIAAWASTGMPGPSSWTVRQISEPSALPARVMGVSGGVCS